MAVAVAQLGVGERGGQVEWGGLVGVAGDGVGEGAGELVAQFSEGDAEAVDDLFGAGRV